MGIKTNIEYCDSTINPIVGCEGCELWAAGRPDEEQHCYAATLCKRWAGKKGWPAAFDQPEYFPGRMEQALGWPDLTGKERADKPWLNGYPRLIFLNDLSDTFISDPDPIEWLPDCLQAMVHSPHIWLFLTKRPKQMVEFFAMFSAVPDNFWLGTSLTSPETCWRADALKKIREFAPEARLWLSVEPLLGDVVEGMNHVNPDICRIDWVVAGGESGKNARACHPDWARALREWAQCWGFPFFWKQWGEWVYTGDEYGRADRRWVGSLAHVSNGETSAIMSKVGKKAAGRMLDGREWVEMPDVSGISDD